jgi:hypothetical protein
MDRNSFKQLLRWLCVAQPLGLLTLVAVGNLSAQTVSFIARRDFATGISPQSVVVADFNGDGKPDLAVASSNISVLINNTPTAPLGVVSASGGHGSACADGSVCLKWTKTERKTLDTADP